MTAICCSLIFVAAPLLVLSVQNWNDLIYYSLLWLRYFLRNGMRPRLPPGNMGLPFVGEMLHFIWCFKFLGRPDDFINSKKLRYGEGVGLFRSHLFGSPCIIACSLASSKFVLQSGNLEISWPSTEILGKKSLLNIKGKEHALLKNFLVKEVNHPNALRRILQVVQPHIIASIASCPERDIVYMCSEMKKITFENVCKMFVSMEPGPFLDDINKLFLKISQGIRAYPIDFPGFAFYRAHRCRRKLVEMFTKEVVKRRRYAADCNDDLLDKLMIFEGEDGNRLSDDEVVDNIVSLILGGYETTAFASFWALYHIAKSPEIGQKLREECKAIKKGKEDDGFITVEDVSKMKYTAKVVEETLRIASLSFCSFRVATKDINYKGYTIPKGYEVLAWLRSVHTDEKNFENPMSFVPERWEKPENFGVHIAFGGGSRICAGNMLARHEIIVLLYHLILRYKWEIVYPDAKIKYLPRPEPADGAAMKFTKIR